MFPSVRGFLMASLVLFTQLVWAQKMKGFDFGASASFLNVGGPLIKNQNSSWDVYKTDRMGFDLGASFYYVFSRNFELRFNPSLAFENQSLSFQKNVGLVTDTTSGSSFQLSYTYVRLPLHGITRVSHGVNVVYGFTYNIQVEQPSGTFTNQVILKKNDFTVDLGLNFPIPMNGIVLTPEIRYCKSVTNVAGNTSTDYSRAIAELYRNRLIVSVLVRPRYRKAS